LKVSSLNSVVYELVEALILSNNLFISARNQTDHWVRLFIYVIEKVAHPGYLLNAFVPPNGHLPASMEVA